MPDILITDDGPIRTIRMNRPDKKNALTLPMYDAMSDAMEERCADLRCILIAGAPGAFTAGNDIGDFVKASESGALAAPVLRFLHVLMRCETPLVAAVSGIAVGIGTTMLLHCDHVVAGTDARLSTPFVPLGLAPEAASTLIAPRMMGHARAFSLLAMGRPLSADDAKAAGIVNQVVAPRDLEETALAAAREIAALPPESVKIARTLLRGPIEEIVARSDHEADIFQRRLKSPEAKAAFTAFLSRKQ
jgi:enoyl-CoA hydratase/carnithine racemase